MTTTATKRKAKAPLVTARGRETTRLAIEARAAMERLAERPRSAARRAAYDAAMGRLAEAVHRIADYYAGRPRYYPPAFDRDDCYQVAMGRLPDVVKTFDPGRSQFTTVFTVAARNAIWRQMGLARSTIYVPPRSRDRGAVVPAIRPLGDDFDIAEPEPDIEPDGDGSPDLARLAGWLAEIDERSRLVLSARWGLGGEPRVTLAVVAGRLGITKERVRQVEQHALGQIRRLAAGLPARAPAGRKTPVPIPASGRFYPAEYESEVA